MIKTSTTGIENNPGLRIHSLTSDIRGAEVAAICLTKGGVDLVKRIRRFLPDISIYAYSSLDVEFENIGIVAIGNAPTALLKVMELIDQGKFNPDLAIGVPVGFVSAVESKDILSTKPYPFITSLGRKGGSPAAVAIINGILRLGDGYPCCQYNPV